MTDRTRPWDVDICAGKMTARQIAERHLIDRVTVYTSAKRLGCALPRAPGNGASWHQEAIAMHRAGKSVLVISGLLGKSRRTVSGVLGLVPPPEDSSAHMPRELTAWRDPPTPPRYGKLTFSGPIAKPLYLVIANPARFEHLEDGSIKAIGGRIVLKTRDPLNALLAIESRDSKLVKTTESRIVLAYSMPLRRHLPKQEWPKYGDLQ